LSRSRSSGAEFQLLSSSSCSSIVGGRRRISSLATTLSHVTPRVVRLAATSKAAAAAAGESDSSIVEGNGTADQLNTRLEEGEEAEEGDWSSRAAAQRRVKKDVASMRDKIASFTEKQSKYFWLGGPILITTAIVLPSAVVSLVAQLQKNFLLGVATAFGFDVLFVLAADAFFVLTDKTGHHQRVSSEGPPPWIGPWEYTGYPAGEPALSKAVSFAGVAIAAATLVLSLLVGKLGIALPALGPYLALIFAQLAYERLMSNDRLPVYPLVPIVYTVYRFRQLARGMELVAAMGGDWFLSTMLRVLMVVWTFYLGVHLSQLPWLYSTWNSNRAT
jgi:hypothetical protein